MNQRSCGGGVQNTVNQGGSVDYETVVLPAPTSVADVPIQLKKPRKILLYVGTDTGSDETIYLSFVPTGQAASGAFVPNKALSVPVWGFTKVLAFRQGIQNFFLSVMNANNPGSFFLIATDALEVLDQYTIP